MAGFSTYRDKSMAKGGTGCRTGFDDDCDSTATDNVHDGPCLLVGIQEVSAAGATTYLLGWDHENPVVGTDAPDYQVPVADGATITILSPPGFASPMDLGFSFACTTTGGTAATGDPTTPTDVHVITQDKES